MIKEKYTDRYQETTLNIVQSRVESVRKKDIVKTGLRLYRDGNIGVSGAIGSYSEAELENRAKEALSLGIPYGFEASGDKEERVEMCPEIIKDSDFPAEMDAVLTQLREQQPNFSFSNKIRLAERETALKNDRGLDLLFKDRFISVELFIKDKKSANLIDAFAGYHGRNYDRQEYLRLANDICNAFQNPVELPKGTKLPVVFNSSNPLPLLQFIKDLNGQTFATGSSLLSGKAGEKVFSDRFTLYQSLDPNDSLEPFFDAEGVVNTGYRYALIDKGQVVTPYTDKKTAAQFGLPLTGSARAEYDGVPTVSYLHFKVGESNKTVKELLQGQMAIFVLLASGGDFTSSGDFATPVQVAYLFDGEKFIGKLPELQLSSNVFAMFGPDFVGVGKDTLYSLGNEKFMVINMTVAK